MDRARKYPPCIPDRGLEFWILDQDIASNKAVSAEKWKVILILDQSISNLASYNGMSSASQRQLQKEQIPTTKTLQAEAGQSLMKVCVLLAKNLFANEGYLRAKDTQNLI